MKVFGNTALARHLEGKLERAYCIFSEDNLLLSEARASLRIAVAADERQVALLDADFNPAMVMADAASANLFGGSRLLEFVGSNPLSAAHGASLAALASGADTDVTVAVAALPPRKAKWVDDLEKAVVRVDIPQVKRSDHAGWVKARAGRCTLKLDDDQLSMIASLTEGDLASAAQLLDCLRIVADSESKVANAQLRSALFDSTSDDVFSLREAMAAGDVRRLVRALRNLHATGAAAPLVAWALAEEGRVLLALIDNGRAWVPSRQHMAMLQDASKRIAREPVLAYLAAAARSDWCAKGLIGGDPWLQFERLACAFGILMRSNRLPRHMLA